MAKNKKKAVREAFRDAVFTRDGHKCVFCQRIDDLDAHHITDRNEMPNGGYVKENGITLCPHHHELAEEWHKSGFFKGPPGFLPRDLYKKIKSSKELATVESILQLNGSK